jgi:hypothetical protein
VIDPGETLGKGRDELAFPAPWSGPQGFVSRHISPAPAGEVVLVCDYEREAGGERCRMKSAVGRRCEDGVKTCRAENQPRVE